MDDPKWRQWTDAVEAAPPTADTSWNRLAIVPLGASLASALVLATLMPPFVQEPTRAPTPARLSLSKLVIWSVLAGVLTAVLTWRRVFEA
jgi:hypothetical protein